MIIPNRMWLVIKMSAMKLNLDVLKAAASKQEVIEGSGEDEKSCMNNECIVAVNSSSGKDSEKIQAIWDKPESTASHATTHHHRKVQLLYCMLIIYFSYSACICITMLHD